LKNYTSTLFLLRTEQKKYKKEEEKRRATSQEKKDAKSQRTAWYVRGGGLFVFFWVGLELLEEDMIHEQLT